LWSERFCQERRSLDFDTSCKYNTIYNGIKIVSVSNSEIGKIGKLFPKDLEIGKNIGKFW
jgi:hypothetical protein